MMREYFILLGRISSSPAGKQILEGALLYLCLYPYLMFVYVCVFVLYWFVSVCMCVCECVCVCACMCVSVCVCVNVPSLYWYSSSCSNYHLQNLFDTQYPSSIPDKLTYTHTHSVTHPHILPSLPPSLLPLIHPLHTHTGAHLFRNLSVIGNTRSLDYLSRLAATSLGFTDGGHLSRYLIQLWSSPKGKSSGIFTLFVGVLFFFPGEFVWFLCVGCLSCFIMSCLASSCLVLSCLVLSCLVLSCLVLSCLVLSCLVLSCLVLSCPVLSCPVLSYCLINNT